MIGKIKSMGKKICGWIKRHKKMTIVLVILLFVILFLIWKFVISTKANGAEAIQSQQAATGTIKKTVEGDGTVSSGSTQDVTFSSDVLVKSVKKYAGDTVKKGETIVELTSSALEDSITSLENQISTLESSLSSEETSASSTISSKVAGRVKRIYASEGTSVSKTMNKKGSLMEIAADGKLKVEFTYSRSVSVGDTVKVKFSGYTVTGKITKKSAGKATAVFSDSYYYNVGTSAKVYNTNYVSLGKGTAKSNSPITVTGDSGTVSDIKVVKNQKVYAGTTLITLTGVGYSSTYESNLKKHESLVAQLKKLKTERNNLTVTAKHNGTISTQNASTGSTIKSGQTVCKISSSESYKVSIDVDELDIKSVKVGQSVSVTVDAVENKTFTGKVTKVSTAGTNTDGVATYPVTVELEDAKELLPAMSATATITTAQATNAVLVPVSAIQTKNNKSYVTILSDEEDETGTSTEVTVGIMNDSYAQIKSGVKEGDLIKLITRSSSNSNDKAQMKMNGQGGSGMGGGSGSGMSSGGQRPGGSN
ncbi:MAG: efflux RND transporter periplasmic adaptor subunit [Anaerostipes sp.]|nr:efflux RND transporter periplasmic adaptor subunit [Anaerostipes sp.]